MENVRGNAVVAQKLALERRLLEEEKLIVELIKCVKAERNGVQIENLHMLSMLKDMEQERLRGSKSSLTSSQEPPAEPEPTPNVSPRDGEELNLTVPQHSFYDQVDEEFDDSADDDFEIEMNMLMNGRNASG